MLAGGEKKKRKMNKTCPICFKMLNTKQDMQKLFQIALNSEKSN